jgi:hypothetical protein
MLSMHCTGRSRTHTCCRCRATATGTGPGMRLSPQSNGTPCSRRMIAGRRCRWCTHKAYVVCPAPYHAHTELRFHRGSLQSYSAWSRLAGIYPLRDINHMEHEMCRYLDWNLTVDSRSLSNFRAMLSRDFCSESVQPYPTYSMDAVSKRMSRLMCCTPLLISQKCKLQLHRKIYPEQPKTLQHSLNNLLLISDGLHNAPFPMFYLTSTPLCAPKTCTNNISNTHSKPK